MPKLAEEKVAASQLYEGVRRSEEGSTGPIDPDMAAELATMTEHAETLAAEVAELTKHGSAQEMAIHIMEKELATTTEQAETLTAEVAELTKQGSSLELAVQLQLAEAQLATATEFAAAQEVKARKDVEALTVAQR